MIFLNHYGFCGEYFRPEAVIARDLYEYGPTCFPPEMGPNQS